MKTEVLHKPEVIISNEGSKHNYFGWPSVVKLASGTIIAGASGFRLGHICPFGKGVISYSFDEGKTFTPPVPVIDTVLDDRDVGLCRFGENGLIVTSFNNSRLMQEFHSQDRETKIRDYIYSYLATITDEDENEAIGSEFRISTDGGVSFGKIYKSPVTSPHGPVELSDGSILWVGSNYFRYNNVTAFDEYVAAYSLDIKNGEMTFKGRIPDIYEGGELLRSCEPYAIELDNGDILCHIRTEPNFTTYQSISHDKGTTWTDPEKILCDRGGAPCHILKHSSGALVSLYGYRQAPYEIRAMFSFDNGKTWDKDHTLYINGFSGDLGYPCSIELDDKSILSVFYAKEKEHGPCVIFKIIWKFDN